MGHRGCHRYIYIASARDQGGEYVNQFYFSFGLDDRYLIVIVTKCYRVLQEPVTLVASLTRNFRLRPVEILQLKLSDSTFTPASGYIGFGFLVSPRGIDAGGGTYLK
jgi:hypothetical protein